MGLATDLIYIVFAGLLGGLLAHFAKQPLLIGYMLSGIVIGPYTGGVTIQNIHDVEMLAEIGIALLLFAIGLEFSLKELKRLSLIALVGTPIQIALCTVIGYYIALSLGIGSSDAIWISAAITLSSTMVVIKTLQNLDALQTKSGKIMIAVLIAQDLAVVPLLLILPQLSTPVFDTSLIITAVAKSIIFLGFMYFVGTRFLPKIFEVIARQGSSELFFLSILSVALGAGFLSHHLGLSFALGALIAGMLLSATDFNHKALSDVSNLKDLFSLIFFLSVGMLFDPNYLIKNYQMVLILIAGVLAFKALIIGGITKFLGYKLSTALRVGLGLSQVGEFAFVITNSGFRSHYLSKESYSLITSVAVISMVLTPFLFKLADRVNRSIKKSIIPSQLKNQTSEIENQVVIIGAGVVGRYVAKVLASLKQPYILIESNHSVVKELRAEHLPVIFGDATNRVILETVNVNKASLAVITTTNDKILPLLTEQIRTINPDLPIVVRVEEVEDINELRSLKVAEIIQPQFEVALEMLRQSMLSLKINETQIITLLSQLRREHYELDKSILNYSTSTSRFLNATRFLEFVWAEVAEDSTLADKTLLELRLREQFSISVVAIIKDDQYIPSPPSDLRLGARDMIGVLGTKHQIETFKNSCAKSSYF